MELLQLPGLGDGEQMAAWVGYLGTRWCSPLVLSPRSCRQMRLWRTFESTGTLAGRQADWQTGWLAGWLARWQASKQASNIYAVLKWSRRSHSSWTDTTVVTDGFGFGSGY